MASTLLDEIQAAIRAGKSAGMAPLITKAEQAAEAAVRAHAEARDRALDPLLSDDDVAAARKAMEDAAFTRDRMTKAAATLREKLTEFRSAEDAAGRQETQRVAAEKVAHAVARLQEYPEHANAIGAILRDLADANQAVAHARHMNPGVYVPDAETIARGVQPHDMTVMRLTAVRLPALTSRHAPIWGPPNTGFGTAPVYTPEITNGGANGHAPGAAQSLARTTTAGNGALHLVSPVPANNRGEAA